MSALSSYDSYGRAQVTNRSSKDSGVVVGDLGPVYVVRKAIAASDQDTTLFPTTGAPNKCRIVDAYVDVSTGNTSETLTLRDTSGGSGNALSSAISIASTGRARDAGVTAAGGSPTIAAGGNVYLRRNTTVAVGVLVCFVQYEQ